MFKHVKVCTGVSCTIHKHEQMCTEVSCAVIYKHIYIILYHISYFLEDFLHIIIPREL